MSEERFDREAILPAFELEDSSKEVLHKAGRVAVAAALVTTLAAGPTQADAYELPQPTPIVYVLEPPTPEAPAIQDETPDDEGESFWQRLLKLLKYALIVLLLLGTCIFGAIKGCAALAPAPVVPDSSASSASSSVEAAA